MAQGTRYPTLAFITGGVGEASDGTPRRNRSRPSPTTRHCYRPRSTASTSFRTPRVRLEPTAMFFTIC